MRWWKHPKTAKTLFCAHLVIWPIDRLSAALHFEHKLASTRNTRRIVRTEGDMFLAPFPGDKSPLKHQHDFPSPRPTPTGLFSWTRFLVNTCEERTPQKQVHAHKILAGYEILETTTDLLLIKTHTRTHRITRSDFWGRRRHPDRPRRGETLSSHKISQWGIYIPKPFPQE